MPADPNYFTPHWPVLARFFAQVLLEAGVDKKLLWGYTEIIRYLALTDITELMKIIAELEDEKEATA